MKADSKSWLALLLAPFAAPPAGCGATHATVETSRGERPMQDRLGVPAGSDDHVAR